MRVFLTSSAPGDALVQTIQSALRTAFAELPKDSAAASFEEADIALFIESAQIKFRDYPRLLAATAPVRAEPGRCFTFDFTDWPIPLLPGLYTSLPRQRFDARYSRAAVYWAGAPADLDDVALNRPTGALPYLFTFRGAQSSPLRQRIFAAPFGNEAKITPSTWRWGEERPADERQNFIDDLRDSGFVLCPKGNATSTLRIYEVMQAGRVPVIIADDWVPPDTVDWDSFAVRVAERDIAAIPAILAGHAAEAAVRGARARACWEESCRPGPILLDQMLRQIESLVASWPDGWDAARARDRWAAKRTLWRYGCTRARGHSVACARAGGRGPSGTAAVAQPREASAPTAADAPLPDAAGTASAAAFATTSHAYGDTAPPPPGCTSKCRCDGPPLASPELPTKPICWPAVTWSPSLSPGAQATPATQPPRLSLPVPRSLLRWMYSYIVPLAP